MGVCDGACTNPNELSSIQKWYTDFCAQQQQGGVKTAAPDAGKSSGGGGGGGTWYGSFFSFQSNTLPDIGALTLLLTDRLSNHYQWVIFLVIMVVAIIGIWVGACVWRKRYLRKRDRQYALASNLGHATESGRVVANDSTQGSIHVPSAGMFQPAPIESAAVYGEKTKGKKNWLHRDRS